MYLSKTVRSKIGVFAENVKRRNMVLGQGLRFIAFTFGIIGLLTCLVPVSNAYTVIILSTGVPESVEQTLLTQTTTQFNASVIVNPLVNNTYQVKLFGLNPNYQPITPTPLITLDQITQNLTAISTYTYVQGFASGMVYERNNDSGMLGNFMGLCDNATNFFEVGQSTFPIDSSTCQQVLGFMDNWIITQSSGLAVVPNPPPGF